MAISLSHAAFSTLGIRSAETPKYDVLLSEMDKEIRAYGPSNVATTVVQGDYGKAVNEAFRILAGYIFGANEKKTSISMTAPVLIKSPSEGEKIEMGAPVMHSPSEQGWVMAFMMPSKYNLQDLPLPRDPRVKLEQVSARTLGVIRYRGSRSEHTNQKKAEELRAWLEKVPGYEIVAGPFFAGYDPPWTLPFLRRNEMMFELRRKPGVAF